MNLSQLFLERASRFASQPAITDTANAVSRLSFAEFSDGVQALAGGMQGIIGLRPGDRVIIWMENNQALVETMFAVWAAGACVVPINAKLHPREVGHIVGDSQAAALFTTAEGAGKLAAHRKDGSAGTRVVIVGSQEYRTLKSASPVACSDASSTDPAWIFYTSGTTGFPKGAILTHRNLLYMAMTYYADIEHIEPGHTMLHAAPLSHGAGLYLLPHLLAGGHQVILPRFDAASAVQALADYPAVSMFAVPTMISRMVQAARQTPEWQGNISTLIYGGAPMYVSDLIEAMDVFGTRFYQLYGQGESPMTITGLSSHEHAKAYAKQDLDALATTGYPRFGVQARVVDDEGRDLPLGEPGEIVAHSDCVMSGYWNNPKATAAALRDGWLWTGDIGRLDAQGRLELIDRSKDMILSGGTNIYPREIEEVLLTHPAVYECSAVGRSHPDMGEEVVAFVVCHEGSTVSPQALDDLCLSQLARFKRPRQYFFVPSLPKSSYGKILKNALRERLKPDCNADETSNHA